LNGLENHVHTIQAAACETAGTEHFLYHRDYQTQGKLETVWPSEYSKEHADRVDVASIRLDDLLRNHRAPDLIKIDVEGAATMVLRGATEILSRCRPALYIECHGTEHAGIRDELLTRGYVARTTRGEIVRDPLATWHPTLVCTYEP
jgi:FkbM family methyltransferase